MDNNLFKQNVAHAILDYFRMQHTQPTIDDLVNVMDNCESGEFVWASKKTWSDKDEKKSIGSSIVAKSPR